MRKVVEPELESSVEIVFSPCRPDIHLDNFAYQFVTILAARISTRARTKVVDSREKSLQKLPQDH